MALQSTTALATVTLQSASSTVTFSGIPNTYRDLILVSDVKNINGENYNTYVRINGDTGNNNPSVIMQGNSSGATSFTRNTDGAAQIGWTDNQDNSIIITQFLDYSATDKHKTILSRNNTRAVRVTAHAIRWTNTNPITSLQVFVEASGTLAAGSTFSLYGRIA